MKAKTFGAQYELIEFNHYIDSEAEEPISVVDIVIECDNLDYIEKEFSNIFIIDTEKNSYVFYNYEVSECDTGRICYNITFCISFLEQIC